MMLYSSLALLTLLPSTLGHFLLNYPATIGFDDDSEGEGPCGGVDIVWNETIATNITVDQFAVAIRTTHPQAEFLIRATTATSEPLDNLVNIAPVLSQSGLGDFCISSFSLPSNWTGTRGFIQVIQNAVDGMLYQCAAVNFVEGSNSTVGPTCTNGTGVTVTSTTETGFDNSTSTNASASTTSSGASSTASSGAGVRELVPKVLGGLAAIAPVGLLLL